MTNSMIKPQLSYTIICDDVRPELGGKFSLMGLFENISASAFPTLQHRFAIVSEWTGGKGEFLSTVRLLTPDKQRVLSESESRITLFSENQRHRSISVRFNTTFAVPGVYWVETLLDGERVSIMPLTLEQVNDKNVH
jgi:hypothetical protein